MGLVPFGPYRVGFWVVARGIQARAELPAGVPVRVSGEASDDRRALVLAAADAAGQVAWGAILHDDGASVLLPVRGRMLAGLGARVTVLDEAGGLAAERLFEAPVLGAWTLDDGLFLLGEGRAWRVDDALTVKWTRTLDGEMHHVLGIDDGAVRLVAMSGTDWRELEIDVETGADVLA
jgi:hypothetical protein